MSKRWSQELCLRDASLPPARLLSRPRLGKSERSPRIDLPARGWPPLSPHPMSTQTRSNPQPTSRQHGNGKSLLFLNGDLDWLLTSPVSFTVLQKHQAKPQNREAQVNRRDSRSPPTPEKNGWAQFTLLFAIWRYWDCPSSKTTSAQVFIYLEIHRGYLLHVVVLFEKLQSSNQGEGKQKQISQLAGPPLQKGSKENKPFANRPEAECFLL